MFSCEHKPTLLYKYFLSEKSELLYKIIAILDPEDKFMIEHYFELKGCRKMLQKEIAEELGVKQRYVSYRINRSMKIIKKIIEAKRR